jgi:hypothetical protein
MPTADDVQPQTHRAVDVPRLRDRLLEGWRAGHLHQLLTVTDAPCHFPVDAAGWGKNGEDLFVPWSVDRWTDFLITELADAPLYYVTREMTPLVSQAAQAMPYYRVHEDQLPSRSGLVVFGDVVCAVPPERLNPGQRVLINAAFWVPVPNIGGIPGLMLVTLQDTDVLLATQPMDTSPRIVQQILTEMRALIGPLAYHEEYPLPWGDRPYNTDGTKRVRNTAVAAMICTWTLMRQRITVERDEPMPRSLRRQYIREGRPEPVVRTTTLRQAAPDHQDPQERDPNAPGRTYSKRWVVGEYGYWRNTWYPSKERHEQQFVVVPSYIKGPRGAPLIGGERVNVLRR